VRIFQINCFCTNIEDSGNPAAVVVDCDALSPTEKQSIAKKLNFPVTTFVLNMNNSIPLLEYYYPESQMPLCLHGTIAAAHWLYHQGVFVNSDQLTCNRRYNEQCLSPLIIKRTDIGHFLVEVFVDKVLQLDFNLIKLARTFLQVPKDSQHIFDSELLFEIASVGSPKFFIPVKTRKYLDQLKPDLAAIKQWSIDNQISGIYVYAKDNILKNTFYARNFNPKTGCPEDAATGVAAGALSCGLERSLTVFQGENLGRPSKLEISYVGNGISWVGGLCVSGNELTFPYKI